MDKHTYVTRLKKMLLRFPTTTCTHCPARPNYKGNGPVISGIKMNAGPCRTCQTFNGLKFRDWTLEDNCCPCFRPNAETAVARAWKKIREWEEKHGEIA